MFGELDMQMFYNDLVAAGVCSNDAVKITVDTFRSQYAFVN